MPCTHLHHRHAIVHVEERIERARIAVNDGNDGRTGKPAQILFLTEIPFLK